ncbi:hypothetical protein L3Q82_000648 [Scortum barcoo]|uniref:Uncharacterized protein n=1 Tax=Scortum barcoo TaxID=214431 RepID=A0ACB8WFE3_9TELE|nr:hypothetical protein L3Q82_000648 [Scortum barcoo]
MFSASIVDNTAFRSCGHARSLVPVVVAIPGACRGGNPRTRTRGGHRKYQAGQASRSPEGVLEAKTRVCRQPGGPGGKNMEEDFGSGRSSPPRKKVSVYARVLERRIRPIVDPRIQEEQCGFRPGRGTVDQLYTLRRVLEGLWEFAQPVHMCFVDLEKAFPDRVPHVVFCGECSASMGSGAFAKGCSVSVLTTGAGAWFALMGIAGSKSDLFPVHVGLRQGCPLSPVLFIIFMDRISRRSQGPEGVRFGNHRISSLLFADDVVLLASSSQDLQHVLERFAAECEAAGMRISTSKSEAMVLDRKRVVCPLRVSGEVLPQVEEFKYLGVLFTSEGKMEREIDRRIGAASAVMRSVYRTVVVKKELSRKGMKLSIYRSIYASHSHLWS